MDADKYIQQGLQDATIELGGVSELRQQIAEARRQNIMSPAEETILDICERITELLNQVGMAQV